MTPRHTQQLPALLAPDQVAALLGVNPATLRAWRSGNNGPDFVMFSPRVIRYPLDDLMRYIRTHRRLVPEP